MNFKQHSNALILLIDECLKKQGKSRYWLSKQTGLSRGQLSNYFNLKVTPSLENFLVMLHALDMNLFIEAKDSDLEINVLFEKAMDRLGRRPDNLN